MMIHTLWLMTCFSCLNFPFSWYPQTNTIWVYMFESNNQPRLHCIWIAFLLITFTLSLSNHSWLKLSLWYVRQKHESRRLYNESKGYISTFPSPSHLMPNPQVHNLDPNLSAINSCPIPAFSDLNLLPHKPLVIRLIAPIPNPNPATHILKQTCRRPPVPLEMDMHSVRYPLTPMPMLPSTHQVTPQDQSTQAPGERPLISPGLLKS